MARVHHGGGRHSIREATAISKKKKPAVDREAVKSTAGQCPEGMEPGRVISGSAPESQGPFERWRSNAPD